MFYNPQLRVFHGEIIARAYVNNVENPITTTKKQAQQSGNLGIKPDFYMEKTYTKAMEKVIKQLEVEKAFLAVLDKPNMENPKSIFDSLPVAKFYY